jgi:hypothetical protein
LGCWVMPKNQGSGMLEDFLLGMVGATGHQGMQHAEAVIAGLPEAVRQFKDSHRSKSVLHTWLAWQEEPGPRPAVAITRNLLSFETDHAKGFLGWLDRWIGEIEKGVQE